jgi:hypothetical protein
MVLNALTIRVGCNRGLELALGETLERLRVCCDRVRDKLELVSGLLHELKINNNSPLC